jgi:isopenicillin-N N-acyltransferase like protein
VYWIAIRGQCESNHFVRNVADENQIGLQHGQAASEEVRGSIAFYENFFRNQSKLSWPEVLEVAKKFGPNLQSKWPDMVEEMHGIAAGAGVEFNDILALNVRTEIAYGMYSDGCTAFAWKTKDTTFLAQNWDWSHEQHQNIIQVEITQPGKPKISMMTEGGIVGKIGLNSSGVGVTLNAIRALGVSYEKMPVHLALRTVLNSNSGAEAADALRNSGVAAAAHIQIADKNTGVVGFECTAVDIFEMPMNSNGVCTHSNHLVEGHKIQDKTFLADSPMRLSRIGELIEATENPTMETLAGLLKDEQNYPTAINRAQTEKSSIETLFSIVMDLTKRTAIVKMGRPTEGGETFELTA